MSKLRDTQKYRAGLYIRLSREDGDKDESDSIASQRMLLLDFVKGDASISTAHEYVDDGWSGSSFDRPGFLRMQNDIDAGKINCVVVKDLSRLGRSYIETGRYLEQVFPEKGVRFVSVGDGLDSIGDPGGMDSLIVPFKNIINDEYARDISRKIKQSLDVKRRQGRFIGSFAPYGYKKSELDRGRLEIDAENAQTVRRIFDMLLSGQALNSIARALNAEGIAPPGASRKCNADKKLFWSQSAVRRILKNEEYTGCLLQGKRAVRNHRDKRLRDIPEESWIRVKNTHEPIISEEIYESAQQLLGMNVKVGASGEPHIFAGRLKCGECGRALRRKSVRRGEKEYAYFVCATHKQSGYCTEKGIREDELKKTVLAVLQEEIGKYADAAELKRKLTEQGLRQKDGGEAKRLRARANKLRELRLALYPDYKSGVLELDEYNLLKERYGREIAEIERREARAASAGDERLTRAAELFLKHGHITELTREVVVELIEEIRVTDGEITIVFAYGV